MAHQVDNTSRLPVQLLSRVLQHDDVKHRLQACAAVSKTWRAAAVAATQDISVSSNTTPEQSRFESLAAWLSAHGRSAAVVSISACNKNTSRELPELQLPVQQLQELQQLELERLTVKPAGTPSSDNESATALPPLVLDSSLTALTSLELHSCLVHLRGLESLTGLQHLAFAATEGQPSAANSAELQQALPVLARLTHLELGGPVATDAVLQQAGSLPKLQQLILDYITCSTAAFQQLPQSLTKLKIKDVHDHVPKLSLGPHTTPGLCQLTALQDLEVGTAEFNLGLLTDMTSLTRLHFQCAELKGPPGLSVLTRLTKLKHLGLPHLREENNDVAEEDDDIAAVTANSQLTSLDIGDAFETSAALRKLFPPGRQLPQLSVLRMCTRLAEQFGAGRLIASCCSNLKEVELTCTSDQDLEEEEWDTSATMSAHLISAMQPLKSLTKLYLHAGFMPMPQAVWRAVGKLTQLQSLEVFFVGVEALPGAVLLTNNRRLRHLRITAVDEGPDDVKIELANKDTEDARGSVHWQLVPRVMQAIHQRLDIFQNSFREDPTETFLLLSAGLEAQQAQAQQQEQQQQQQIGQLQGQIVQLQQQVAGLQATLTGIASQLQHRTGPS